MDDLMPLTLSAAARQIGLDPFEVMRLRVLRGESASLRVPRRDVEALKAFAGIEVWWLPETPVLADEDPLRGRVRTALSLLLEHGHIGASTTRLDNLWRGLPLAEQAVIDDVVHALAAKGLVAIAATERGLFVAAPDEDAAAALREAIDTRAFPPEVAVFWEQA